MTKGEITELFKALHKVLPLSGAKFQYGVNNNIGLLKAEIESLDKAIAPSAEFVKFQEEFEPQRIEIAEKYTNKDKDDKPLKKMVEINGKMVEVYDMFDNETSNKETEAAMKAKNPELYEARIKQLNEYQELLKEEVKIAFFPYQIKLADVPNDINGIFMKSLCDTGIIVEQ